MAAGDLYQDPQASKKKPQQGVTDLADYGTSATSADPGQNLSEAPSATAQATSRPQPPTTPQPAQTIAPPPAGTPPDPFAASGGGTYFASTGQWLPNNNPTALAAAQAAGGGQPGTGGTPPSTSPPEAPDGVVTAPPVAPPPPPVTPPPMAPTEPTSLPPEPPQGPGTVSPPVPPPPNPNADRDAAYKSALLKMLDTASTPATLEDPALKAQSDAAAVGLTRATEAGRSALAERMAQEGGGGVNSGAFNSELAGLFAGQ